MLGAVLGAALLTDARASTIGVVIGAAAWWEAPCVQELGYVAECKSDAPDKVLRFADDDAWRMSWYLAGVGAVDETYTFTTPDDSSQGRRWPGGPPAAPTLDAIQRALSALPRDESVSVIVYVAAHGERDRGVHLGDGVVSRGALLAAIEESSGGVVQLVMLDVCHSAKMRGQPAPVEPRFSRVGRSAGDYVEASVRERTPEAEEFEGGAFTLGLLSALSAGERGEDGRLAAQMLSDHVAGFTATLLQGFSPVIRAPEGRSAASLPPLEGPAGLLLHHPGDARWLLSVPMDGGRVVLVNDLRTTAEAPAASRLPASDYQLYRVTAEGAAACALTLSAGETLDVGACGWSEVSLRSYREVTAPLAPEAIRRHVTSVAPLPADAAPSNTLHWHGRPALSIAARARSPLLDRTGLELGAAARGSWAAADRLRLQVSAGAVRDTLHDQPGDLTGAGLTLGADLGLWGSYPHRAGLLMEAGGEALRLTRADDREGASWALVVPAGLGGSLLREGARLSVSAEALWTPTVARLPDDLHIDAARGELRLLVGVTP